ncbi:hypothetical protein GCM10025865_23780 [Paraoerskovia sediminicola]|uniref:Uncharacterized protein n=1 Tax=Paraoerskovia sediminicola TaxID=1138587 RepID=A0ABM8G4G5_9CELL|nr:hypothetical protein [Paraoerskovia sediminicola]BDZ43079.1 hypothetical protein GCM10025865_23780 [Paraoerskovia sediminicola]
MPGKVKMLLMWLIIAFLVYAVINSPDQSANLLQTIWNVITQAFSSIGQFFSSLLD